MGGIGGRCRSSGLVLLICVVLLSAATMANGIRTGVTGAPAPAVIAQAAAEAAPPPVATAATTAPSEQADPFKDSKRKVPNGPDPIHNRRARWGDAPARRG